MSWTLIEPCAGSAAFTFHLLGARRAVLPYQGSKWRFRHALARKAAELGFVGAPETVLLTDPGPWGLALGVLVDPHERAELIGVLREMAGEDPQAVYARLHGASCPEDPVQFSAEFLFLQRLAFSGKAVGCKGGKWASPGFNKTSAYGTPATERFGAVKPMVPSLIRTLTSWKLVPANVVTSKGLAGKAPAAVKAPTLVYLDPPYSRLTPYPDGDMAYTQVIRLAKTWRAAGAAVMVSEQEELPLDDWSRARLYAGRKDTSPFRGKQEEWITFTA